MTVYTRVDVMPREGTGEISLVFWPSGVSETSIYANYGAAVTIPHKVARDLCDKLEETLDAEKPEADPRQSKMNELDDIDARLWDIADWMESNGDLAQEALVEAARELLQSASGLYHMMPHFTLGPRGC